MANLKEETITLPAGQVMKTVLATIQAVCECDGHMLAELAAEFYPIPDEKNLEVVDASFDEVRDTISLTYGPPPEGDEWEDLEDDMEDLE